MSAPDTRLVPMTREQRDALADWTDDTDSGVPQTVAAWDAAPADPHEMAALCVSQWNGYGPDVQPHHRKCVDSIFAALGCVPARETNEEPA